MLNYQRVLKWKLWDVGEFQLLTNHHLPCCKRNPWNSCPKIPAGSPHNCRIYSPFLPLRKLRGKTLYIRIYIYIYLIVVCGFKLQLWCPLPHIEQAPEMVHDFFREMGRNHFPARLMTVNCAVFSSQVPKITGITLVVEPPAGHTGVRKTVLFSLQKYQQNWCQIGSTPLPGLLFLWVVSTCFKYV